MELLASAEPWLLTPPLRVLDSFQNSLATRTEEENQARGATPVSLLVTLSFLSLLHPKRSQASGPHLLGRTDHVYSTVLKSVFTQFLITHELGSSSSFIEREGRS